MNKKVAIIDYSLGNIFSVRQALTHCGADAVLTSDPDEIKNAHGIVLPGVGAFGEAMKFLRENKLDVAIKDSVQGGKPFLGICLGMQLLFDSSEEFGSSSGLGVIPGSIQKFQASDGEKLLIPQVGWNTIEPPDSKSTWRGTVLDSFEKDSYMYFVHSYYARPLYSENELAITRYGSTSYCSAVTKENVIATQFHPEKSGEKGLQIYTNWLKQLK